MSVGYNICCTECGFGYDVLLGVGMMCSPGSVFGHDGREPMLAKIVEDKRIAKEALSLLKKGYEPDMDYKRDMYVCPKCCDIVDRFLFRLRKGGEEYVPRYECPKCRVPLRRAILNDGSGAGGKLIRYRNGRDIDWRCPKYGNDTLWQGGLICWD